jgi:rod shape-determining protein MreD
LNTAWVRVPLLLVLALVVQSSLLSELRAFDVAADLMMLIAIAGGIVGGPERGAVLGFASGLTFDLLLNTPFGMSALAFTLIGYGVGLLQTSVLRAVWWIPLLTSALASAAGVVMYVLVATVVGEPNLLRTRVGTIALVVGVLNGLLAVVVVPAVRWALGSRETTERALA